MGLTTITRLVNRSSVSAAVEDIENSHAPGHNVWVPPGGEIPVAFRVPWATSRNEFRRHHLFVNRSSGDNDWIWQAWRSDGDFVRTSRDGEWHDPGNRVAGVSRVNGSRTLVVYDHGVAVEETPHPPPPPPPPPQIPAITVALRMLPPTGGGNVPVNAFAAVVADPGADAVVVRCEVDESFYPPSAVGFAFQHTDAGGRSAAFNFNRGGNGTVQSSVQGLRVAGKWTGRIAWGSTWPGQPHYPQAISLRIRHRPA
jgi:hypothetical protein